MGSLAIGMAAALGAIVLALLGTLGPLDRLLYDQIVTRLPAGPPPAALLVAIDEPSFAEIGQRWPWDRALHARLIVALREAGARTIAFDILFVDPGDPADDAAFVAAMGPDVVLGADRDRIDTPQGVVETEVLPLRVLRDAGARWGRVDLPLDPDGGVRALAPSPLGLARAILGPDAPVPPPGARMAFAGAVPRVSYYQALDPDAMLPPHMIAGRDVIVGLALRYPAEVGTQGQDMFRTPWTARGAGLMPGAEVQAHALHALATGAWIAPGPVWAAPLLALVLGVGAAMGARGRGPAGATIVIVGGATVAAAVVGGALALGHWIAPGAPLLALVLAGIGQEGADLARERQARRAVVHAFSHYLAPSMVERLARDPRALRLGGELRTITVMFCDLRGFTTLAEAMKDDPEALTTLVTRALTPIADAVLAEEGAIDKFLGDCVMGIWNAPLDTPDHADRAIAAGVRALDAIAVLNRTLAAEGGPRVAVGVGINTGACVVGNMGTAQRFDYTALGDAVNVAARLEEMTKTLGPPLLIGADAAAASTRTDLVPVGDVALRGRAAAVGVYTLAALIPSPRPSSS